MIYNPLRNYNVVLGLRHLYLSLRNIAEPADVFSLLNNNVVNIHNQVNTTCDWMWIEIE